MTIFLDCMSPCSSSVLRRNATYRKARRAAVSPSCQKNLAYFGLASSGVYTAFPVTREAVVPYTAIPPLPQNFFFNGSDPMSAAVSFLLHWPWGRPHRTLSGTLPCEARTFLTGKAGSPHALLRGHLCCSWVFILTYGKRIVNYFQTLKQLPPTNSRRMELFGTPSLLTPRK